jgi:hypothetical protein
MNAACIRLVQDALGLAKTKFSLLSTSQRKDRSELSLDYLTISP